MNNQPITCPHCSCDDASMLEIVVDGKKAWIYYCNNCSKEFYVLKPT